MATPETIAPFETPSDRLQRWVGITFVAVSVILLAAAAASLWQNRATALRLGQLRTETLAFILGDHLNRNIVAVNTALGQLALYTTRLGGAKAPNADLRAILDAAQSSASGVANLAILDENGVVTQSTLPTLVGQSRANTALFRRLSGDPGAGLVSDDPLRGSVTGHVVIPLGRRLTGPDGRFAGAVVAAFEPEHLQQFYRAIAAGRRAVIWLVKPDGTIVFREPAAEGANVPAVDPAWRERFAGAQAAGSFNAPLGADGAIYFHAFQRTENPPLVVMASIPESTILSGFAVDVAITAATVAGFLLLLIAAWIVLAREFRKRAKAEQQIVGQSRQLVATMNERERAHEALGLSQARFMAIMDNAPMMISLRDLDGRFTFVNRAFLKFWNETEENILGRTVYDLRSKEHADMAKAQDHEIIRTRQAAQWEFSLDTPNGPRSVLIVKFPVIDGTGTLVSLGSMFADITDQKRAEAQLAQAQRIEAVGQLTGGIAHDFNNLLTSILLNADVLASLLDEKLRPLAESVRMAAERGADLTRRLLAFGRRQMLEPRPTDIRALLDGMGPLMRRTLGAPVDIRFEHGADLWSATVDPGQLENAVVNLAVNARDAMPEGGTLTIETANTTFAEGELAVPEAKPGDYVMITVRDTGTGMTPEVVARAFEPFFTTKDVGKGTGLGLSMVYGFVKQSGGHAHIVSELGKGTAVRLYLPRSTVAPAAVSAPQTVTHDLPTGKETILFVEDDPLVRQHTGRQIVGFGYNVVTAENAAEAIAHVENGCAPDLLFTDVVMPGGINGRQLAHRLRERWPNLRVLYTSGYAQGQLTIDGESVPSKYVLGKPYRRADLAAKLRDVLDEPAEP